MPAKKEPRAVKPKVPARPRRAPRKTPTLHLLRVTLRHTSPPIWRRFIVPSEVDLGTLHTLLQAVMGWGNEHLHQFVAHGARISSPDFELDGRDGEELLDENATPLQQIAPQGGDAFVYEYDLGDGWDHDVVVEAVREVDGGPLLWCLDGARACPPDDCGGVPGYERMLEALARPDAPEHAQAREWLGDTFDPEAFDARAVNRELTRWVLTRT